MRCPTCDRRYGDDARFCLADGVTLEVAVDVDPLVGAVFEGRYRIDAVLGAGGMGVVYAGRQLAMDRRVAVKVLRPEAASNDKASARFIREARLLSQLESQHTVTVFDYGETEDGQRFIAMEYLEGITLQELLREGVPPLEEALRIIDCVAESLAEAHAKHIVHRDLKPSNVFLARTHSHPAFVKVLDFGIARPSRSEEATLTETGQLIGTPAYMSPELLMGERVEAPSDIYALGLLLYELVSGKHPFVGKTKVEMYTAHLAEAPPVPESPRADRSIAPGLAEFIMRCLAKQPALRPRNADAFRRGLAEATVDGPTPGPDTLEASNPFVPARAAGPAAATMPTTGGIAPVQVVLAVAAALMLLIGAGTAAFHVLGDEPAPAEVDVESAAAAEDDSDASTPAEPDAGGVVGAADADDPAGLLSETTTEDASESAPAADVGPATEAAADVGTPTAAPRVPAAGRRPPRARTAPTDARKSGSDKAGGAEPSGSSAAEPATSPPGKGGVSAEDRRKIDLFRE